MKTDIEKSRLLFEAVKRPEDCWHELKPLWLTCLKCSYTHSSNNALNPNFFDPGDQAWNNFGWLLERMNDHNTRVGFLVDDATKSHDLIDCAKLADALWDYLDLEVGK